MVQNSPDTTGPFAYGGYDWTDSEIRGFSLVHLSGPGVKKGGDIPFMPTLGPASDDPRVYASPFDHAREHAEPGYYRVTLGNSQTDVELATSRPRRPTTAASTTCAPPRERPGTASSRSSTLPAAPSSTAARSTRTSTAPTCIPTSSPTSTGATAARTTRCTSRRGARSTRT